MLDYTLSGEEKDLLSAFENEEEKIKTAQIAKNTIAHLQELQCKK